MTTLSLTLPISCQICLGKVKDPVICSNNHAFCTVCLDVWLQNNGCCPTCRVDITEEKPYRKVIGSSENNETLSLHNRMQLRKTRLEILGREYETEIQNLNRQLLLMNEENEKLKEDLKTKAEQIATTAVAQPLLQSNNIEAFSSLTKKLQEISTTYDDVRRDMNKLQQEKEKLQRENADLKNEVLKLKEDSMFTKSPKRYEKFTITGLKAKVEQYEKENQQLKKALQNSDKYVEQLQSELRALKTDMEGFCEKGALIRTQCDSEADRSRAELDLQETAVTNSTVVRQLSLHDQFEATVVSITPLNHSNPSESSTVTTTMSSQTPSYQHETAAISVQTPSYQRETTAISDQTPSYQHELVREQCQSSQDDTSRTLARTMRTCDESNDQCSRDLFPATKKLLALKKIHETRSSSSPPSLQIQDVRHVSPVSELPWPSSVSRSSSEAGEETSVPSTKISSQESSETFPSSFTEDRNQFSECSSNNVILTAAGPWAVPSSREEQTHFYQTCKSPKRNSSAEPFILNKKIKVEKDE